MIDSRQAAAHRETARMLRRPAAFATILAVLNRCPMTAEEAMIELRGRYGRKTIYSTLQLLRLAGLVESAGYKAPGAEGGFFEVWRVV